MEQVSLKIGERLKEIRNTRQLTLDDVAELTGVSKPMLGQIEKVTAAIKLEKQRNYKYDT